MHYKFNWTTFCTALKCYTYNIIIFIMNLNINMNFVKNEKLIWFVFFVALSVVHWVQQQIFCCLLHLIQYVKLVCLIAEANYMIGTSQLFYNFYFKIFLYAYKYIIMYRVIQNWYYDHFILYIWPLNTTYNLFWKCLLHYLIYKTIDNNIFWNIVLLLF